MINADKKRAADIHARQGVGKESVDNTLKIMTDPQVRYTLAPERVLLFAQFMHQVGTLKNRTRIMGGIFFPEIHRLNGN